MTSSRGECYSVPTLDRSEKAAQQKPCLSQKLHDRMRYKFSADFSIVNTFTYSQRFSSSRFHSFLPYILLSLLCFALYLPGIFTIPMDDRDSAHFAQATRQMLETGNYFQIRYQETTRYQKPPGINWLQALAVKTFSTPESNQPWPYRLPSVIGGWLSVLLTFFFTQKVCGRSVAIIASVLLASTVLLNIESHLATIDASLLVSVVLMQGALWIIYNNTQNNQRIHWKWPFLFFLSMAYGIVLKGITPLVGFLTLLTLSLIDKTTIYLKKLHLFWGVIFLLAITATWLIGVSYAEHTNYLMQMLHKDLLPKLAGGHESHGAPFGTHLALLILTFWPASLFLWPVGVYSWRNKAHTIVMFLLAWIIPTWIFFECMPTKLPQYILPIFPALAILAAHAIISKTAQQQTRTMQILTLLWVIFSLLFSSSFLIIPLALHYPLSSIPSAYIVSAILAITTLLAAFCIFRKNYYNALMALLIGNCLGFGTGYQFFLPALTPVWTSQKVADIIDKTIPGKINQHHPLIVIGYGEPSLVFLLGTHAVQFRGVSDAIKTLQLNPSYVLVDKENKKQFLSEAQINHLKPIPLEHISSFNYTKGHWISLGLYQS